MVHVTQPSGLLNCKCDLANGGTLIYGNCGRIGQTVNKTEFKARSKSTSCYIGNYHYPMVAMVWTPETVDKALNSQLSYVY